MGLLKDLQRAKFKGISFYWVSSNLGGGRKTITHEYPNSDRRFVEDLGKSQKRFTVQGVISGANYLRDRDSLIDALESAGVGILVHPLYGSQNVVAKPFTLDESDANLGEARFSMTFEKADRNIFPTQTSNNTSLIASQTTALLSDADTTFTEKYNLTTSVVANYNSAKDKVENMLNTFEQAIKGVNSTEDKVNAVVAKITNTRNRVFSIITSPSELAESITDLFNSISGFATESKAQVDMLTTFYTFGDDDAEIMETTPERTERKNNEDALNDIVLTDSLTLTYESTLELTFGNTTEIDTLRDILNTQTNDLTNKESLDPEIRDSILDQKLQIDKYLDQQETVTPKVTEAQVQTQPLMTLGYRYYGDTDNFETLVTLNNNPDINFIEGTVKVLSQ